MLPPTSMTTRSEISPRLAGFKATVTRFALELGFDLVRIASAQEFAEDRAVTLERLQAGLMDGLPWYNKARVLRGTNPQELLPGARSIICLGLSYNFDEKSSQIAPSASGKVARYAWVQDYHKVMKRRMKEYVDGLTQRLGAPVAARWYVDDGPMLDRAAAQRSGLGWFGKNTNILTNSHGSWVFLGQVITDIDLDPDPPLKKTCGECVRCIDACPTGAIVAPYVIDNTRCISYLTIENRGPIPREMRPQMLDWVFGCDICQDVCPVNRKASIAGSILWSNKQPLPEPLKNRPTGESPGPGQTERLDLVELLHLSEEEFRSRFRRSPILRAKRVGLQRNACVALGNRKEVAAVPALTVALFHGEPLVRGHAAWALGQIGTEEAREALEQAEPAESDANVLEEIAAAQLACPPGTIKGRGNGR